MASRLVPISSARGELFDLFEQVVRKEGDKVLLKRRGWRRQAALVSADYLASLEARARPAAPARRASLHMAGTVVIGGEVEAILARHRQRQARQDGRRLAKLARNEATWRRPEQGGRPLPSSEMRPQADRRGGGPRRAAAPSPARRP
ncbi:MAG: hypothetical protein ACRD01_12950 [Terriglobales bacterium]